MIASLVIATLSCLAAQPGAVVPDPWPYREKLAMVQRAVLPGVDGRLDHMAFDPASQTLYVAAHRNNSIEALHLPGSTISQSIPDVPEPSGVVFAASSRRLVVTCTGDNKARVYAADAQGKLEPQHTVAFPDAPDALALDDAGARVYVAHGSRVGSINLETGLRGPDIDVGGRPEAMIREPAGARLFVNVPSKLAVVVLDLDKRSIEAEWSVAEPVRQRAPGKTGEGNYPLAHDAANKRLFVPLRTPAELLVLDTGTGRVVATMPGICKDADDCWYDAGTRRVLITGGGGAGGVTSVAQNSADEYINEFTISTSSGARTSMLVPDQRKLFVAAPRLGDDQAYIFVYLIGPR